MNCRHCKSSLDDAFVDLGFAPPSNAYLTRTGLKKPERYYPLKLMVCTDCWLVQTEDYAEAHELFESDYAYFSSTSSTWVEHAKHHCDTVSRQLGIDSSSFVIEIGSNDGYLLQNFVRAGVPCIGIEPTASTAAAAEALGIPVIREFFGQALAEELAHAGRQADLIIGNNVYAHVPDINDFTRALKTVLKRHGTITLEFPHLLRLIEHTQFDTVYHEHYSYLSLYSVGRIFERADLRILHVEELPTHGGSLRVYGVHAEDTRATTRSVQDMLAFEMQSGLRSRETYRAFQARANEVKNGLLWFLLEQKRAGVNVAAYGAAAKGNTLLNYAGVKPDLLPYVCDAANSKVGKFLPGSHIEIVSIATMRERRPDLLLILPWNIAEEIISQQSAVRAWGGKFAIAVPEIQIL